MAWARSFHAETTMPPTSVDNHCRRICKWAFVTLKTLYRNIPDHPLSVIPCRTFDPLRCDREHRRLHRVDIVATWHPFPPDHPSPGCRASLTGAPSSTCATFPQQVTHVPRTTTLLPCTSPGTICHGGHVVTMGTGDVPQQTLLEMWRDGIPE